MLRRYGNLDRDGMPSECGINCCEAVHTFYVVHYNGFLTFV